MIISNRFNYRVVAVCMLMFSLTSLAFAAPGNLVNSPLFTTNSAAPNIFFEVDDSGSMDWEVMATQHWRNCAYDKDSYRDTGDNDCGSLRTDGLIQLRPDSDGAEEFEYLYNNSDDAYTNNCSSSRETFYMCNASVQSSDWRIRSSDVNVLYYNPGTTYVSWENGDGSAMANASFTAVRSDPLYTTDVRSLDGFIYEVWEDTHGFSGTRPRRGTNINRTDGANGLVDLWDKHTRYTVSSSQIVIEETTYAPLADGTLNPSITTSTLSGTDTLNGKAIAEVQQNIANWYQYARRRSFVTKSAIAKVISDNPGYRYGLNFINNTSFPHDGGYTSFVEMPSGSGGTVHNSALISGLFGLDWPAQGTPLRDGLKRAGEYYDHNDGRDDPIIEQCQQNFSILFTDGYWNGNSPSGIGDEDGDLLATTTVADVAKYYYDKDLSSLDNTVLGNVFDPATHQHMVTYTVAFGLKGLLSDTDNDGWPGNSPGLAESADWGDPSTADSPEKIDDLWHAAFNSKGAFVSAGTPEALSQALTDALSNISDRIGSGASAAFNTTTLSGDSSVFLALFNSTNNQWNGDLLSFALDSTTGDVAATSSWSAADVLEARANPVTSRKIFTYDDVNGNGVPFLWTNLTATQKADLKVNPDNTSSNDAKAEARLNFIRGDSSNEAGSGGTYTFRDRIKLLGDIVHSDPVFVGAPQLYWPNTVPFPTTIGTNTYDDFKTGSASSREPILYVGANDGMLHGFKTSDGSEVLAYVPNSVFSSGSATSGLHYLTDTGYTHRYYVDMPVTVSDVYIDKGAGNNWNTVLIGGGRTGSRGIFALDITDPTQFVEDTSHAENLVLWEFDATDDADLGFTFSKPTIAMMNNGEWAAIFGNGYNSTGTGEASLFIVFLEGGLDGVWTSGSDYIKISTETGSIVSSDCSNASSDCNGLSTPQTVDMDNDKVVDRIYAGDLKGNMWAFDVSASNTNSWGVAYKSGSTPEPLFTATYHEAPAGGGAPVQQTTTPQPITEKPILVKHPSKLGGDPDVMVFFGTGQYLTDSDVSNTAVQSFYGVWDNGDDSLTPANLIEQDFLSKTFTNNSVDVSSQVRVLTNTEIDYAGGEKGWVINLTLSSGERIIVDPDVRGDLVYFNTWIPDANPCSSGGNGFLMSVEQINGGRPDSPAFDFNGDGNVDSDDLVSVTETVDGEEVETTYAPSGEEFNFGLPSSSNFLSNKQYTPGTDGGGIDTREVEDVSSKDIGRLSWQELRK